MIILDPCWLCISLVHSLLVLISSSLYRYVTVYLYICWWTLGSFLTFGYYKLSFTTIKYLCTKYLYTNILAGSYDRHVRFLEKHQSFPKQLNILHFQVQCMRVPVSLHLHQHLVWGSHLMSI